MSDEYRDEYEDESEDHDEPEAEELSPPAPGPNQVQCFVTKRWVDKAETVELPYKGSERVNVLKQFAPR